MWTILLFTRLQSSFPYHKVIYIIQPKHTHSPSVKMQRSLWTFNNLASQLSTTITLNARSSTFLHVYLLLTAATHFIQPVHLGYTKSLIWPALSIQCFLKRQTNHLILQMDRERTGAFDRRSFPGPNCSCTVSWSRCTSCKAEKMMILSLCACPCHSLSSDFVSFSKPLGFHKHAKKAKTF